MSQDNASFVSVSHVIWVVASSAVSFNGANVDSQWSDSHPTFLSIAGMIEWTCHVTCNFFEVF